MKLYISATKQMKPIFSSQFSYNMLYTHYTMSGKRANNILHVTSSNIGRFSKFFLSQLQEICNKAIIRSHYISNASLRYLGN